MKKSLSFSIALLAILSMLLGELCTRSNPGASGAGSPCGQGPGTDQGSGSRQGG